MPALSDARAAAEWLQKQMQPHCARIAIAGSIRRGKPDVKDIEFVAIGRTEREPAPGQLFDTRTFDTLDRWCAGVANREHDQIHKPERQGERLAPWGPRYKRLLCAHDGYTFNVDLFIATAETWGPLMVIRTGPGDFSRRLVTQQSMGGAMPTGFRQREGRLQQARWCTPNEDDDEWTPLDTPDEEAYFAALGLPCWPPEERSEERLVEWLKRHGRITGSMRTRRAPEPYTPFRREARANAGFDSEAQ